MSAIVIGDSLIHYEAIGRGEPLIFIHGWLGSWRYWVPAMEELSSKYRTYALDLWGFGDSDRRLGHYNVNAYVALLKQFMEGLGVSASRTTLVGHALGGVVALSFASEFPSMVERLLGVSVPLVSGAINRPLAGFSGDEDALTRLVARRANFPEVELEVGKTDLSAITDSMRSAMESDVRLMLPPLSMPVLLVYGGGDGLVQPSQQEWLEDCHDNVRTIFLNGARHFPMLEEQSKFNRLLIDFLEAGNDLASLALKEEWQRRLR